MDRKTGVVITALVLVSIIGILAYSEILGALMVTNHRNFQLYQKVFLMKKSFS